jgi:hypothetical protein
VLSSAEEYDAAQRRITAVVDTAVRAQWRRVQAADIDASWAQVQAMVLRSVVAGQLAGAQYADGYVTAALDEQNVDAPAEAVVQPTAFAGVASDGRPLDTLVDQPVIVAKTRIGQGTSPGNALAASEERLSLLAVTMVQDAARAAVSAAITARPAVQGWVRMLRPPSCARCAILAGRWYRWNADFDRHPRCDCGAAPAQENVAGDLTTDPMAALRAGQIRGMSRSDTRAVLDGGADLNRVVNFRGVNAAGARRYTGARATPEQIYRAAGDDRAAAIDGLRSAGFLI